MRLGRPRSAAVTTRDSIPVRVGRVGVEAVLEEWVVEDRWWTARRLRRRYLELVLEDGRNVVVFHELDRWYEQRA